MVVHFDMLCACMEDGVLDKLDVADVVAVDRNWLRDGNLQILQQSLKPNCLTCCYYRYSIFGLLLSVASY